MPVNSLCLFHQTPEPPLSLPLFSSDSFFLILTVSYSLLKFLLSSSIILPSLWASFWLFLSTLHLVNCFSLFHLVLFLRLCLVLSFGRYSFVSSLSLPPCAGFYILGLSATSLGLGRVTSIEVISTQALLCGQQRSSSYGGWWANWWGQVPRPADWEAWLWLSRVPCWAGLLLSKAVPKAQMRLLHVCWWTSLAPQSGSHFGGAAWVGQVWRLLGGMLGWDAWC